METESFIMEDLLNFSVSEAEEEKDDEVRPPARKKMALRENILRSADSFGLLASDDPELIQEEDLEWISNKDAFPVIETFVGVLMSDQHLRLSSPEHAAAKQLSPVSVLETRNYSSASLTTATTTTNSSGSHNGSVAMFAGGATAIMSCCGGLNVPVKARSKRRRIGRRDLRVLRTHHEQAPPKKNSAAATLGRKCTHCGSEKTPQWRAGPAGPKTLCNACGVRFKSGRLVPEYRPANSPTFLAELHSNSHRRIMEMRKQRQVGVTSPLVTGKTVDKGWDEIF